MKKIQWGIERIDEYIHLFEGKRVGLITNHTGFNQKLISSIDVLKKKVNLVCLFAPEHGVRGDLQAGDKLESYIDKEAKLPVYSLYGESRRPSKEMMDSLDVICYDIQDIGVRFYTYIYTLSYVMSAAKEYNKEVIVFDRPNPLGRKVEGNLLNMEYKSFVGYHPIVQRYGMTCGEIAQYFNNEYNINCNLHVIPMANYDPLKPKINKWIAPSPNIPTFETCYYFLATVYFEGTNLSEGRGTTTPFKVFGAPWLDTKKLLRKLKGLKLKGIEFKQCYFTPWYSKNEKELCKGIELFITDFNKVDLTKVGMHLITLVRDMGQKEFYFREPYRVGGKNMIDYLTGDDFIRLNSLSIKEIFEKQDKETLEFINKREKYLLY